MKRGIPFIIAALALSAFIVACDKGGDKKDTKAPEGNPALAVTAPAGAFAVDNVHSMVIFRIKHMNAGYIYGRFNGIGGYVNINDKDLAKSAIVLKFDVNSVDTNVQKRDDHLRSPDFFDAKKFPTASFTSKKIAADGKNYRVTGDFELHGVKKEITATVVKVGQIDKDPMGNARAGGETKLTLKRSDYGVSGIDGKMPGLLSDEVDVTVAVEATRK